VADLRTRYMGIDIQNPIVVGACSLSKDIDTSKESTPGGGGFGLAPKRGEIALPPEEAR